MNKVIERVLIIGSALIVTVFIFFGLYTLNSSSNETLVIVQEAEMEEEEMEEAEEMSSGEGRIQEEVLETIVTFTINTQDFSYPEKSAEMMTRLLALHEQYDIPLSISFTHPMIDYYSQEQSELWHQLSESPLISFGYHIRPPLPYHSNTPHRPEIKLLPEEQLQNLIRQYETHGLDLETGRSTEEAGGFGELVALLGDRFYTVGVSVDRRLGTVLQVYADLGATFFAGHVGQMWLGKSVGPLHVRPEQEEIKAFQYTDEDPRVILDQAIEQADRQEGVPTFINVKMHDNDFFAEQSAWTAVYLSEKSRRLGAPFDLSQVSALLSAEEQESVWVFYEGLLRAVAEDETVKTMTVAETYELIK